VNNARAAIYRCCTFTGVTSFVAVLLRAVDPLPPHTLPGWEAGMPKDQEAMLSGKVLY
jgi:hypothetical protein